LIVRLRGLLTQFHPSLERVLGPRLDHPVVTHLLERFGSPAALHKAERRQLVNQRHLRHAPRRHLLPTPHPQEATA
jgi:hypothetical protein